MRVENDETNRELQSPGVHSNMISPISEFQCSLVEATDRIVSPDGHLSPHVHDVCAAMSPCPAVLEHGVNRKFAASANAICDGITAAVRQWAQDQRLRDIIPLPPRVEAVLLAAPSPYQLGFVRPDFLFRSNANQDGCPVACFQINAHFPLDGLGVAAAHNYHFLKECMTPSSIFAKRGLAPDSAMTSLFPDVCERLTSHGDKTVWVLIDTKPPADLDIFGKYCDLDLRYAKSSQLTCVGGGLFFHNAANNSNDPPVPIKSALLYLQQKELMSLPLNVFAALAALSFSGGAVNDLRTIFLANDKRMLHILTSDLLLDVDECTRKLLRETIVPTALLQADGTMVPLHNFPDKENCCNHALVLEPCVEGNGEETIFFGKNMSALEFSAKVRECAKLGNYVVQAHVEQPHLPVLRQSNDNKAEGASTHVPMFQSVGTLITFHGRFYGNGLMRVPGPGGSLSGCGGMIYTAMRATALPAHVRSFCDKLECADTAAITRCLVEHGVALIGVRRRLGDKQELVDFLKKGLGASCHSHSDVAGEVWDVRPRRQDKSENDKEKKEGSLTTREIEPHTDASFELEPPRFLCLSVIRADANGGGVFSMGRIADAVAMLTDQERHVLQTVEPCWIVPPEFRKSGVAKVKAPVLMSHTRARVRSDNLELQHLDEASANAFGAAFACFYRAIENVCDKGQVVVPQQTVVILDNQRFAHSRSQVLDDLRHLHRVRFDIPSLDLS